MAIKREFSTAAAVLWASAFVITALIIVQAGRHGGSSAYAETAAGAGHYSLLTVDSGRGDDQNPDEMFFVLDSRDEVLLVYEVDGQRGQIALRDGGSLQGLFNTARR